MPKEFEKKQIKDNVRNIPKSSSAPAGHFERSLSEFTSLGENIFQESGEIARKFQEFQDNFRTFGADVSQSFTERGLTQRELDFGTRKKVAALEHRGRIKEKKENQLGTFDMLAGLAGMGASYLMGKPPGTEMLLQASGIELPFVAPRQEDNIFRFLPFGIT